MLVRVLKLKVADLTALMVYILRANNIWEFEKSAPSFNWNIYFLWHFSFQNQANIKQSMKKVMFVKVPMWYSYCFSIPESISVYCAIHL